jgi:hypothetical protein
MLQIVRAAQLLTMHSSALDQTNSPLLRLPAELRNRVYEYVFGDVRLILGNWPGARIMTTTGHDANALALATTSCQLYVETKLLPFVLGHLLAYSVGYLMSGIKKLGPEQRQAIRNIEFDYYDSDFSIFKRNSGEIFSSTLPAPSLQDLVRPILDEQPGVKTIEIEDFTKDGEISRLHNESNTGTSDVNIIVLDQGY